MSKGLVRIRLARFGRKHAPVYNIVVANAHKARDKTPIEVLGTYNPIATPLTKRELQNGAVPTKDVKLDFGRTKYWIGVGAQPSDTVTKLLIKSGVLGSEWSKTCSASRPVVLPQREVLE
ncbi:LANO_0B02234g1_1 [Lachancea nothofagi CBS 11611]|uniref:LANO_0B02234g1_1 n=1 Tax=Lachancea nothofagi CBS 11611 TaxID=1266666 RepID=A0A1G4IW57_9SACH|nr:LANO_0B02234g1_1 [Lachancea nothofagi CBS 11611]